jgi:hypothetical protein
MHADHRTELTRARCGDPRTAQLACPARLAHPAGGRTRLARGIGDTDIAAKPDDIAKTQIIEDLNIL